MSDGVFLTFPVIFIGKDNLWELIRVEEVFLADLNAQTSARKSSMRVVLEVSNMPIE